MKHQVKITNACAVLLLAGCSPLHRTAAKEDSGQEWARVRSRIKLQMAQEEFKAAAFEDAARTAAEALALDPSDQSAHLLQARAWMESGNMEAARRTVANAALAGVSSAALTYTKGVLLERRERLDEALQCYRQARSMNPGEVDFLVAEAECLAALARSDEAFVLVTENIVRFDHDATLCALAGHLAVLTGNVDQAIKWYGEAILDVPDDPIIGETYGLLLVDARRYAEALAVLTPLVQETLPDAESGAVRRGLAACHLELGDPQSARDLLVSYVRTNPADTRAHVLLAKAALAAGDMPTALRSIELARTGAPDNQEIWLVQAVAEWKRHNYDQAVYLLEVFLRSNPNDVDAHCLIAETLSAQGKNEDARTHFERALQINPQCTWALAGLRFLDDVDQAAVRMMRTWLTTGRRS